MITLPSIHSENNHLTVSGDISFDTLNHLVAQGIDVLNQIETQCVVDLSQIKNCNSAGLVLLIEWIRYARQHNKQITFLNLPTVLNNLISLSDLSSLFKIS